MSDLPTLPGSARPEEGGPEHDAWLREALRHAPDATAVPPLSLREAILAEARAATRTVPRSAPSISLVDRFAEFWSWLARPPVAAGFASVMAATLVGLMWWDRPMDEAMPQPPSPSVAAAPAAGPAPMAEAPAPAAATATKTTAVPPAPTATTATTATTAATATTATTATTTATTTAATAPAAGTADSATPVPAITAVAPRAAMAQPASPIVRAAPESTTPDRAQRRALAPASEGPAERDTGPPAKLAPPADALRESSKDLPAPAFKAAPAAAPAPFPARDRNDPDAQAVPARPEPAALAKHAEKNDREEKKETASSDNRLAAAGSNRDAGPAGALSRSSGASLDAGASGRFAEQAQPAIAQRQRSAAQPVAPARPMAPLLAALGTEAERWSRSASGGGESVAVDAAALAWLARVDAAASQWSPLADPAARREAALASTGETHSLFLNRAGRLAAIVRIEDGGVVFEPRPGAAWFAPLAPDVVARLRATLPAAAR